MSATLEGVDRARAVERLTALWALNEAGLGLGRRAKCQSDKHR